MNIGLQLDPVQYRQIHDRLGQFTPNLRRNLNNAEFHQLQINQTRAISYMQEMFKTYTGQLADGFDPITVVETTTSVTATLSNHIEYAWRREKGFSGKTDRLGRYYKKDLGIHYMRFVMQAQRGAMVAAIKEAVQDTIAGRVTHA